MTRFLLYVAFLLALPAFSAPLDSSSLLPEGRETVREPLKAEKNFLLVPMKAGEENSKFSILGSDGKPILEYVGMLTLGTPDWYASIDISRFKGQNLSFEYTRSVKGLDPKIRQSDEMAYADYSKFRGRSQFHLTPNFGRMGAVIGLAKYGGKWHAFYEHNPFSVFNTGYFEWGHAVSSDLINWTYEPPVMTPKFKDGKWILPRPGSIFLDSENRSGLFRDKNNRLLAVVSIEGRGDVLYVFDSKKKVFLEAVNDSELIKSEGEEPTLSYDDSLKSWIIVRRETSLKGGANEGKIAAVYTSKDLKKWERVCEIAGLGAYPNLVRIPVTGALLGERWVAFDGQTNFLVGNFDGKSFSQESKFARRLSIGDGRTTKLWQGLKDGRNMFSMLLLVPNFSISESETAYSQGMSLPWDLQLVKVACGEFQLRAQIPPEILSHTKLGTNALGIIGMEKLGYSSNNYSIPSVSVNNVLISGEVATGNSVDFYMSAGTIDFNYDYASGKVDIYRLGNEIYFGRRQKPLSAGFFKFEAFIDNNAFEFLFGSGDLLLAIGESIMTPQPIVRLGGSGGQAEVYYLMRREILKEPFFKSSVKN